MICEPAATRIRMVQHNCAKSAPILDGCLQSAVRTADIILIQEPRIASDPAFQGSHPAFDMFIPPTRSGVKPRVMAFVSKSNPYLKVGPRPDLCNDPDVQILEVSTPAIAPFFIINIYNERRPQAGWTLERSLSQFNIPPRTILGGDFNAHHEHWNPGMPGTQRNNHQPVLDLIENNDLELLNHPGTETRTGRRNMNKSVIDLTFCTPALRTNMVNWCTDESSATGSDHAYIRFDMVSKEAFSPEVSATARYNWKKADWDKFTLSLNNLAERTLPRWNILMKTQSEDNEYLETAAIYLRDMILEAAEDALPLMKPSAMSKRWWNSDIDEARTTMRRKLRQWKRTRTEDVHGPYRQARNQYYRMIKKARSELWKKYLSEAEGKDIFTALKYTNPRHAQRTPVLQHDGEQFTTFEQKATLFHRTMFPPPPTFPNAAHRSPPETVLAWEPVTDTEVRTAIFSCASNQAPGPDGIPFLCLKEAYGAIPHLFNTLYARLAREGYHPMIWRDATTVRKQRGHAFSLDHVWWRVRGAAHPMRTYRRQYDVCVGRVSEARPAPLDW